LSVKPVEHPIPAAILKTDIPKPKGHGNSRNRKACFVCKCLTHLIKDCDYYEKKWHVVPTAVLTRSKLVSLTAARPVTTVVPYNNVTRLRPAKIVVTKPYSPPRRIINHRPSPPASNFPPKVTTVKAPQVNVLRMSRETGYGLGPKETLTFLFLMHGNPHHALTDKGVIDSGCSRNMTGNMSHLTDFEEINGGYVAFGGNPKGRKIIGKGKIRIGTLDFDDVYFVKELKFNLLSVSQMCDKKNSVLFIDTECIVLSLDFKLPDENQVLLRVSRENNMYNVDLKNIVPSGDLTCLFAKATLDKSNLWHRRLGHINFKTMNKLVKGNLVRGLPSKVFKNNHTCVACKKGKQHRASCKTKPVSSVSQPLQRLHIDLFGLTFVKSLNKKSYYPVVIDDYSRFTWVFFLATKDETSLILKTFITGIENQLSLKVKIIRSDNGTEFKNQDLNQLCGMKGIKREFSVARTPQQNGIAKRKNRTLIEAARTVLADSLLPISFWAEAVNTACYNTDDDATFKVKEPEFEFEKPESEVHVSPSSGAKTKKHDDKTKREAKGKSPIELSMGFRNLSQEFEVFFITALISAAGPSNTVVSPTLKKSSYVDTSQYPDDPNMPDLKDITYSDDEEDVGAEADFSNLETTITVSPIPTTRVHKDHHEESKMVHQALIAQVGLKLYRKSFFNSRCKRRKALIMKKSLLQLQRIEAIRLFLAYASFIGFMVYQMDVKSAFFYGTIKEEVYVCQPLGFEDPDYPEKVYKVVKALSKRHQAPRAWSMIGSLMYLTSSRPDIMFIVCACAHFQVTPKASHLHAAKRIFRYLKGKPHLGLLHPKDSPFNLVAYSDSDYAGASLDMKSTIGGAMDSESVAGLWDDKPEPVELKEVTKVMIEVVIVATTPITAATITVAHSAARRRKRVVIRDLEENVTPSTIVHFEPKSKDKGKGIFGMSYDAIRLIFEKYFNLNMAFMEKSKEQLEEEESRALKRQSKSSEEKAAKKQKLYEEVPVVDYEIHTKNNKPYYKIIRADGSHQLFLSFLSLLRNFDREDLEMLWQIVQERFASSKPNNFLDDFLLTTLKAMFEKPDVEAQVWKNQRGIHGLAKVKS
nr:putative ribonuclease H-like domain-containing protein [Tanacetum cinerariifolium]